MNGETDLGLGLAASALSGLSSAYAGRPMGILHPICQASVLDARHNSSQYALCLSALIPVSCSFSRSGDMQQGDCTSLEAISAPLCRRLL